MKITNKIILSIALIPFLALLANIGYAQTTSMPSQPGMMSKKSQGGRKGAIMSKLNLTDAQKTQIRQIFQENRTQMQTIMNQMRSNKKQLRLLMGENYNADKIQALAKIQGNLISQMIVIRMSIKNKIYNILTPEQRAQLKTMKQKMKKKKTMMPGQPQQPQQTQQPQM